MGVIEEVEGVRTQETGIIIPCPFDFNDIEGTYLCYENGNPYYYSEVTFDPEVENGLIITNLWLGGGTTTKVTVNLKDLSVSGEDQIIFDGDYYGYGRIALEDFNSGSWNTCTNTISFIATPTLPDTGLWWGVSPLFELVKEPTKDITPDFNPDDRQNGIIERVNNN